MKMENLIIDIINETKELIEYFNCRKLISYNEVVPKIVKIQKELKELKLKFMMIGQLKIKNTKRLLRK